MRAGATFDSSFWVHSVYLELVDYLLVDFDLFCTAAVEREMGGRNPTSLRLRSLLANKSIQRATARSQKIKLYGDGERAAINLALERELLLLIDDWRPYEAARSAGVAVLNSAVYIVGLYQQHRIQFAQAVEAISKLAKRGTLTPGWIQSALKVIANIRKEEANL